MSILHSSYSTEKAIFGNQSFLTFGHFIAAIAIPQVIALSQVITISEVITINEVARRLFPRAKFRNFTVGELPIL